MRQRVRDRNGDALNPELLLPPHPTTARDVIVQREICSDRGRSGARIAVLSSLTPCRPCRVSDRIAIMYSADIIEEAEASALFARPAHPYTTGLIGSFRRSRVTASS